MDRYCECVNKSYRIKESRLEVDHTPSYSSLVPSANNVFFIQCLLGWSGKIGEHLGVLVILLAGAGQNHGKKVFEILIYSHGLCAADMCYGPWASFAYRSRSQTMVGKHCNSFWGKSSFAGAWDGL